jgi:hypothetical protein
VTVGAALIAWKWRDAIAAEKDAREQRQLAGARGAELERERAAARERVEELEQERAAAQARGDALAMSLKQARRALYVSNVLLIDRYRREGRLEQARALLAKCDRDLRDWEWHFLHAQLHPPPPRAFPWLDDLLRSRSLKGDREWRMVFYDKELLPAAGFVFPRGTPPRALQVGPSRFGSFNFVSAYDAASGASVADLGPHVGPVQGVMVSSDQQRILTVAKKRDWYNRKPSVYFLGLWDTDGNYLGTLYQGEEEPNGWKWNDKDEATGFRINPAGFTTDGAWVELTLGKRRLAWDARTGKPVDPDEVRPRGGVAKAELRRLDGKTELIVLVGRQERVITYRGKQRVRRPTVSRDGRLLAAAVDWLVPLVVTPQSTVHVWDVETGKELYQITGHEGRVSSITFNPKASRLFTLGAEEVKCWDAGSGQELLTLSHPLSLGAPQLTVFPDGKTLALSDWGVALFWDTSGYDD